MLVSERIRFHKNEAPTVQKSSAILISTLWLQSSIKLFSLETNFQLTDDVNCQFLSKKLLAFYWFSSESNQIDYCYFIISLYLKIASKHFNMFVAFVKINVEILCCMCCEMMPLLETSLLCWLNLLPTMSSSGFTSAGKTSFAKLKKHSSNEARQDLYSLRLNKRAKSKIKTCFKVESIAATLLICSPFGNHFFVNSAR